MAAGSVPLAQSNRLPFAGSASAVAFCLPTRYNFPPITLSTGVGFYPLAAALLTEKESKGRNGWFSYWRKQGFHEGTYSASVSLAHELVYHSTLAAAIVCVPEQQQK